MKIFSQSKHVKLGNEKQIFEIFFQFVMKIAIKILYIYIFSKLSPIKSVICVKLITTY